MSSRYQVLPSQSLYKAIEYGMLYIRDENVRFTSEQIQPASIDLRLSHTAHRVTAGFLPGKDMTVDQCIKEFSEESINLLKGAVLRKGSVYIIRLIERVNIPNYVSAITNPKSSIGRLDVFVRIITDFGVEFDKIDEGYQGGLYAEVSSRMYNIVVRYGTKLSQLRFLVDTEAPGLLLPLDEFVDRAGTEARRAILTRSIGMEITPDLHMKSVPPDVPFRVNLSSDTPSGTVGYKSRPIESSGPIDVDVVGFYDPLQFWKPIMAPTNGMITLNPEEFYILASKENVSVSPEYAAEMKAYDTSVGEFRVHYAGFFDPSFGYPEQTNASKAVLEVRTHDLPFMIRDDQIMGSLVYSHMLAVPEKLYGQDIRSNYQSQGLRLGKQFKQI